MAVSFKSTQAIPFFPTTVWAHDLEPAAYEPMNRRMLDKLEALLTPRPPLQPGDNWQTDQKLHHLAEFQDLVDCIDTAVTGVFEFLQIDHRDYEITGCWANINPVGSPHAPHTHPNNYLSGVYYLKTSEGADSISFYDPRAVTNIIAPRIKQANGHNLRKLEMRVPVGRLVLFPAWFQHGVETNHSTDERISIAFNVMLSDFTEAVSPPKWRGIAVEEG